MSRQKELDADPTAIQRIKFVRQFINIDDINADGLHSMFILTILEKNQRNAIKMFSKEVQQSYKRQQIMKKQELN